MAPFGAAALLLLGLQRTQIAQSLDLLLYDLVTTLRPAPSAASGAVTLIGISESDITTYGWPIDDSLLCQAIDRLTAAGASAIGLDLYRDQGVGQQRRCLQDRFRREARLVSIFNVAESIRPVPGTPSHRQAFNDMVLDEDGVLRRDLVHVSGQNEATVAFPMRMVEISQGRKGLRQQLDKGIDAGPWLTANSGGYNGLDAAGYQQMLVFRQPGTVPTWTLHDLLRGLVPAARIDGHIVIIGSTAPTLRDLFEVPHTRFTPGTKLMMLPGVEIQALRMLSLVDRLNGNTDLRIRTTSGLSSLLIGILAVSLGIGLGEAVLSLRRSILLVGTIAVLMLGGTVLLLFNHIWVGLSIPLAGLLLMAGAAWLRRGVLGQEHRLQIEKLLGQTTSPQVAKQLWDQREELLSSGRFEGRLLPVTVVFADTCNFTTVSEGMSPADLLKWFNRGMACCIPAISRRSGMVNKFTGDGFLAVFGAPLSQGLQQDARLCLEAILEIKTSLEQLNLELKADGDPPMRMRIGVHTGNVLAGSIGSSERLEYAVIGDAVNCASRLESLEKAGQTDVCRVLVSGSTRRLIADDWPLLWKSWGQVKVKGREEPMEVWELLGPPIRDSAPEYAGATALEGS